MNTIKEDIRQFSGFIAEYASCLLGSGVHTSRVIRNSNRIAHSFGYEINMTTFQKSFIITISDNKLQYSHTQVVEIAGLPINFEYNSELSSLSWEAFDKHLSLDELWLKFNTIKSNPKMNSNLIIILVGLANAAFCRLFGGDIWAVFIVLVSTIAGFYLRLKLQEKSVNHFITFTLSAFVASFCASSALLFDKTAEIAIATSVLYLIPGVPLFNGVIDILEGHTLTGGSRLVQAFLLIICIALGLSVSLLIFQNSLL